MSGTYASLTEKLVILGIESVYSVARRWPKNVELSYSSTAIVTLDDARRQHTDAGYECRHVHCHRHPRYNDGVSVFTMFRLVRRGAASLFVYCRKVVFVEAKKV